MLFVRVARRQSNRNGRVISSAVPLPAPAPPLEFEERKCARTRICDSSLESASSGHGWSGHSRLGRPVAVGEPARNEPLGTVAL